MSVQMHLATNNHHPTEAPSSLYTRKISLIYKGVDNPVRLDAQLIEYFLVLVVKNIPDEFVIDTKAVLEIGGLKGGVT